MGGFSGAGCKKFRIPLCIGKLFNRRGNWRKKRERKVRKGRQVGIKERRKGKGGKRRKRRI